MNFVIGSGPAGISAAVALVNAGRPVTIVDGGVALEPEISTTVETMRNITRADWPDSAVNSFKDCFKADPKGVQIKYVYGSDFPYREVDDHIRIKTKNVGQIKPSLAVGGFSNVWGAAVLPFLPQDIQDWPVDIDALKPHYEQVLRFMNIAGARDDLAALFPMYTDHLHELKRPVQAQSIAKRMETHRDQLRKSGFIFGAPRLAVRSSAKSQSGTIFGAEDSQNDCVACGLCMYGCPYELIYSSAHTLRQLRKNPLCTYLPDVIVEHISEDQDGVLLVAHERGSRKKLELRCEKAFLGAGVVSSTKILIESLKLHNQRVTLRASEYFLLPMLCLLDPAEAREEGGLGLAQMFIECVDKNICSHPAHLQLYTYSDLYYKAFLRKLRLLGPLAGFFAKHFSRRFCVIQGYLHSEESSTIDATLEEGAQSITLKGSPNSAARRKIFAIADRLLRLSNKTGFFPLLPLTQIGLPGDGRHVGGSFPMSANPSKLQTDSLGRPFGFKNLHVVDATVFPSIPASTITFTAMANAHRIASNAFCS